MIYENYNLWLCGENSNPVSDDLDFYFTHYVW